MKASDVLNIIEQVVNNVTWSPSGKDQDTARIGSLVINWKSKEHMLEFWHGNSALAVECFNERTAKAMVAELYPMLGRVNSFSHLDSTLSEVCSDPALVKRWMYVGKTS